MTKRAPTIHPFCAKCLQSKERDGKWVHEECRGPGPYRGCSNCGGEKEPNRSFVHKECLCR